MSETAAIPAPETAPAKPLSPANDINTDVMNIAKICKASGFSRPTIRRAIDKGELKSFPYANQVCVMRTEYVRWVNSIGQAAP